MKYSEYSKTLYIAEEIYISIFGKPTTHQDFIKMINIKGDINTIIIKDKK